MTKVEKTPQYIKGADIKGAGEVKFTILDEFERSGDYKKLSGKILVNTGDEEYKALWSMSDKVGNQIIDTFGDDTAKWSGKTITVRHAEQNGKDMIVLAQETL